MLKPEDELPHVPGADPHWQENYLFHGWDAAFETGFYLHLQYLPKEGIVDVRAGVATDGVLTTHVLQAPAKNAFDVRGMEVDVADPYRRFRLRYEGHGNRGPDPGGWYFTGDGTQRFGFDVDMKSFVEPVNFLDFTPRLFPDDTTGQLTRAEHYETGVAWSGKIWVGDRTCEASGLAWRDHSWGARSFHTDLTFWNPMVLEEAEVFVSALTSLNKGRWVSFSVESGKQGQRISPEYWTRPGGFPVPGGFDRGSAAAIDGDRLIRYEFEVKRFMPAPRNWTVSGKPNRGLVDVVSKVTSNGRSGIGTMQFSPFAVPAPAEFKQ